MTLLPGCGAKAHLAGHEPSIDQAIARTRRRICAPPGLGGAHFACDRAWALAGAAARRRTHRSKTRVRGCASQVWLVSERRAGSAGKALFSRRFRRAPGARRNRHAAAHLLRPHAGGDPLRRSARDVRSAGPEGRADGAALQRPLLDDEPHPARGARRSAASGRELRQPSFSAILPERAGQPSLRSSASKPSSLQAHALHHAPQRRRQSSSASATRRRASQRAAIAHPARRRTARRVRCAALRSSPNRAPGPPGRAPNRCAACAPRATSPASSQGLPAPSRSADKRRSARAGS